MSDRTVASFIEGLFEEGERSDLVVETSTKTYQLHQIFICSRSKILGNLSVLKIADDGWLRGSLDLTREDPEATDCMLQYLYKDDYCAPEPHTTTITKDWRDFDTVCVISSPLLHVKVYKLAKKYHLDSMRILALKKLRTSSQELWQTGSFLEAAWAVYRDGNNLDKDLCDVIIGVFVVRKERLLRKGRARDLLMEAPLLGLHLLKFPTPWS